MDIELRKVKVSKILPGYLNDQERGVYALDGNLNIRPAYQREFVYGEQKKKAVIDTLIKGYPLNVMYWSENADGTFEVLDGQQRTISILEYVVGSFSLNFKYFHSLTEKEKQQILDYELFIYVCKGDDREKLEWFKTINIAGEKLTDQELLNAIYTGPWLSNAKLYFSKTNCPADGLGGKYLNGSTIRQDFLETTLNWISQKKRFSSIEEYMSKKQFTDDAKEEWEYFEKVIEWTASVFPKYRKEMKGVPWGLLYNQYGNVKLDADKVAKEVQMLMEDAEVSKKKGIYEYVLTRDEKHLSIRTFDANQIREGYEKQKGICSKCKKHFEITEMEADHIDPWSKGGKTDMENLQMLCKSCNRRKSDK